MPLGYASGNPRSDSSTYGGQTFIDLGMTPGTYVWNRGSGVAAVPKPSGAVLVALPLGLGILLTAWNRRATHDG